MIFKKIAVGVVTAVSTVALFSGVAFADVTIDVIDNGEKSDNTVKVESGDHTTVKQTNNSAVVNLVHSSANTGGNSASHNTGDSSSVDTGNAKSSVSITNHGSSNTANVDGCGCPEGDVNVTVEGNGRKSDNYVKVADHSSTYVKQKNNSFVLNGVDSKANSGKNKANKNTGGENSVLTGKAKSKVVIHNFQPTNTLNP